MTSKLELLEQQLAGKEAKIAIAVALAASVFYAVMPILIRISEDYVSPNATIFNRSWIMTAILGLWNVLWLRSRQTNHSVKDSLEKLLVPLLGLVIGFLGTQLLWAWSLSQTNVANSEVLHSVTPGFTTLAGWLLFARKFGGRFLIGVIAATVGAIAIGASDLSNSISLQGDGLALLSAVFYAAYLMSIEKLRAWWTATIVLMWASGACTALSFPVVIIAGDEVLPHSVRGWLALITLALDTVVCFSLVGYSLKWLSSELMATILLLSPILTAVLGWLLFSETLSLLNLLGFAVILAGIYLAISDKGGIKALEN
ncbi:MAG: DMT family transporter [Cyanobacteriota bacterium]|nr:DMT family transporter [Cyanobacteriota bacterium]